MDCPNCGAKGDARELIDSLLSVVRGVMPVAVQKGSRPRKDQQVRPADQLKAIEMLLDRGFGRSPQQLDIPHGVSNWSLEQICLMGYCGGCW